MKIIEEFEYENHTGQVIEFQNGLFLCKVYYGDRLIFVSPYYDADMARSAAYYYIDC